MHAIIRILVEDSETWEITTDDGRCDRRVHASRRCRYVAEGTARAGAESDVDGDAEAGRNRGGRGIVVPLDGARSRRPVRRVGHPARSRAQMSGPAAVRRGADAE
jgi:hypothetical protein